MKVMIYIAVIAVLMLTPAHDPYAEAIPPEVCTEPPQVIEVYREVYEPRYTEDDVYVVAQMLQGECYEYNEADQRSAAITVCNRVGNGEWARWDTPSKIIKCTGFYGWHDWNEPSETNLRIAREVLDDWSAISAGYERPWEPWLYFSRGGNGSNVYRVEA